MMSLFEHILGPNETLHQLPATWGGDSLNTAGRFRCYPLLLLLRDPFPFQFFLAVLVFLQMHH